jgi:hypothetical protein
MCCAKMLRCDRRVLRRAASGHERSCRRVRTDVRFTRDFGRTQRDLRLSAIKGLMHCSTRCEELALAPDEPCLPGGAGKDHREAGRYAIAIERSLEAQRLRLGFSGVPTFVVHKPWDRRGASMRPDLSVRGALLVAAILNVRSSSLARPQMGAYAAHE